MRWCAGVLVLVLVQVRVVCRCWLRRCIPDLAWWWMRGLVMIQSCTRVLGHIRRTLTFVLPIAHRMLHCTYTTALSACRLPRDRCSVHHLPPARAPRPPRD